MQVTKNHSEEMKNLNHLLAIKEIKSVVQTSRTNYTPASSDLADQVQPKGSALALNMIPRTERGGSGRKQEGRKGRKDGEKEEGFHWPVQSFMLSF